MSPSDGHNGLAPFVARKVSQTALTLLIASFVVFGLVHMIPGDPIRALFGFGPAPPDQVAALRRHYGLDDPFFVQYFKFLNNLAHGDLGRSFPGGTVSDIVKAALPVSFRVMTIAFVFQLVFGFLAGVTVRLRSGTKLARASTITTMTLLIVPLFVLAPVIQAVFAARLGWFPRIGDHETWMTPVLPGLTLGAVMAAYVARMIHVELGETLRFPFVTAVRAKGMRPSRVILVHAMRSSAIAAVTLIAASLAQMATGLIFVEQAFRIRGVGFVVLDAIRAKDHYVVIGVLTIVMFVVIVANFVADIVSSLLDPRLRSV